MIDLLAADELLRTTRSVRMRAGPPAPLSTMSSTRGRATSVACVGSGRWITKRVPPFITRV